MSGPLSIFLNKPEVQAASGFGQIPVLIGTSFKEEVLVDTKGSFSLAIDASTESVLGQSGEQKCSVEFWRDYGRYDVLRFSSDRKELTLSPLSSAPAGDLLSALDNLSIAFIDRGLIVHTCGATGKSIVLSNGAAIVESVSVSDPLPPSLPSRVVLFSAAKADCSFTVSNGVVTVAPPASIVTQRPLNAPLSISLKLKRRTTEKEIIYLKDGEPLPAELSSDNCGGVGYGARAIRNNGYTGPMVIATIGSIDEAQDILADLAINSYGGYYIVPFFSPREVAEFVKKGDEAVTLGIQDILEEKSVLEKSKAWKVQNLLTGYGMYYGRSYGMGSD